MYNGILKYIHPYKNPDMDRCEEILEWLDAILGPLFEVGMWTREKSIDELKLDKACGPPFNWMYGPTKGDAIKHFTFDEVLDQFMNYTQASNGTLKDELRSSDKDARLFIPANFVMILVSIWLFGAQNDAMAESKTCPVQIGLQTPGPEAVNFWYFFSLCTALFIQGDGSGHDARLSPMLCILCRELRKRHLPKMFHKMVDRYYDMTYRMKVNMSGSMFELIGQQSGQTNTASDNSIATLALLINAAIEKGLSLHEFLNFRIGVMGDDLLLNSTLTEKDLDLSWQSFGMYIEIPNFNQSFYEMTFMGMHPVLLSDRLCFTYNEEKMLDAVNWYKKGRTYEQRLDKLISIAQLMFASPLFKVFYTVCCKFYHDNQAHMSDLSAKKLALLSNPNLYNLYFGEESVRRC